MLVAYRLNEFDLVNGQTETDLATRQREVKGVEGRLEEKREGTDKALAEAERNRAEAEESKRRSETSFKEAQAKESEINRSPSRPSPSLFKISKAGIYQVTDHSCIKHRNRPASRS